MARTLELDTIQTPSANNANIQLGSDTVTFSSNIAVDINNATIDGATIAQSNITVGPGKTLTVTDGTFTTSATQKKAIIEGAGADVDLGAHEVRAQTFQSDVATGTAPLTVASTTKVANLNASTLDGATKANLFNLDHADVTGVLDVNHGGTNTSTTDANKVFAGPTTGSAAAPAFRTLDRADLPAYQGATSSAVGIKGAVPAAQTGERDQFLKGDGTYATPGVVDNTVSTAKIVNANVTYPKIQNVSASRILGNNTNSAASVSELTGAQVGAMIGNATTSDAGLMSSADKTTLGNLGNIADAKYVLRDLFTYEYTSGNYSATARANFTGDNGGSNRDYCDSPLDYSWPNNITGGFGAVTTVGAGDRIIWEINGGYVYVGRSYSTSASSPESNPTEYSPVVGIILYDHSQTYSHSTRYTNGTYITKQFWPRNHIDISSSSFSYAYNDQQIVQHFPNFKYYATAGDANQTYSIAPVVGVKYPDSNGYIRGQWSVSTLQPLQITVYHWQYVA